MTMSTPMGRPSRPQQKELAWVVAHPGAARAWAASGRISSMAMATTLVLGLLVHLLGYVLGVGRIPVPDWIPADLASILVSNLGIVLWTSVILVVFLEVLPARARRRATQSMALAARTLREGGQPVPAELEDAEGVGVGRDHRERDPSLEDVLERLASIERLLGDRSWSGPGAAHE